jgi:hypothetical protein
MLGSVQVVAMQCGGNVQTALKRQAPFLLLIAAIQTNSDSISMKIEG